MDGEGKGHTAVASRHYNPYRNINTLIFIIRIHIFITHKLYMYLWSIQKTIPRNGEESYWKGEIVEDSKVHFTFLWRCKSPIIERLFIQERVNRPQRTDSVKNKILSNWYLCLYTSVDIQYSPQRNSLVSTPAYLILLSVLLTPLLYCQVLYEKDSKILNVKRELLLKVDLDTIKALRKYVKRNEEQRMIRNIKIGRETEDKMEERIKARWIRFQRNFLSSLTIYVTLVSLKHKIPVSFLFILTWITVEAGRHVLNQKVVVDVAKQHTGFADSTIPNDDTLEIVVSSQSPHVVSCMYISNPDVFRWRTTPPAQFLAQNNLALCEQTVFLSTHWSLLPARLQKDTNDVFTPAEWVRERSDIIAENSRSRRRSPKCTAAPCRLLLLRSYWMTAHVATGVSYLYVICHVTHEVRLLQCRAASHSVTSPFW